MWHNPHPTEMICKRTLCTVPSVTRLDVVLIQSDVCFLHYTSRRPLQIHGRMLFHPLLRNAHTRLEGSNHRQSVVHDVQKTRLCGLWQLLPSVHSYLRRWTSPEKLLTGELLAICFLIPGGTELVYSCEIICCFKKLAHWTRASFSSIFWDLTHMMWLPNGVYSSSFQFLDYWPYRSLGWAKPCAIPTFQTCRNPDSLQGHIEIILSQSSLKKLEHTTHACIMAF